MRSADYGVRRKASVVGLQSSVKARKRLRVGFAHFVIPSEELSDESRDLY